MNEQSDAEPVESVTFWYRNYRGEISRRVAAILGLRWGSSEYHKEPQWLLRGFDLEKEAEREFAVKDMAPTRDALSQSDAGPLRCLITGNPCGADTWEKNSPCRCINCQMWLTQPDAGPVAWQYRIKQGGWGGWHEAAPTKAEALSCIEAQQRLGLVDEYELRPLYTAPPRPDASGLIEAAEWHEEQAQLYEEANGDPRLVRWHMNCSRVLRYRAAERRVHGELIPDCLREAAEWPFGYQDTLKLISDATGLVGGHIIGISVSKFEKAYNKLRSRAADRSA